MNDIDEIVCHVRFAGWQSSHAGERQGKQALRKTLLKVPAAPGPGAVRPGLRLHPGVTTDACETYPRTLQHHRGVRRGSCRIRTHPASAVGLR